MVVDFHPALAGSFLPMAAPAAWGAEAAVIASDELMEAVCERIEAFASASHPDRELYLDGVVELACEIARMLDVVTEYDAPGSV